MLADSGSCHPNPSILTNRCSPSACQETPSFSGTSEEVISSVQSLGYSQWSKSPVDQVKTCDVRWTLRVPASL